jgi:hypothetical protein
MARIKMRYFYVLAAVILVGFSSACARRSERESWLNNDSFFASGIGTREKINLALQNPSHNIYYIYRKGPDDHNLKLIGWTDKETYADTNILTNVEYSYQISGTMMRSDQLIPDEKKLLKASSQTCFAKARFLRLKNNESLAQLSTDLKSFYSGCKSEIEQIIGGPLTESETMAIFSMIISHNIAPYGRSSQIEIMDMLHEKSLNCGNYTWLLADIFKVLAGLDYPGEMAVIGFDGGTVGNHAQVIYKTDTGDTLLLDPTVGIVAKVSYDELTRGSPIPSSSFRSLYSYWTNPRQDPLINKYHWKVYFSLLLGLYQPKDSLYFYPVPKNSIDGTH